MAKSYFLAPQQKTVASLAENVKPYIYFMNGSFAEQDLYGKAHLNSQAVDVGLALLDELREANYP